MTLSLTNTNHAPDSDLDRKMKEAGMVPLETLLNGSDIDKYRVHTWIKTPADVLELAARQHKQYATMFIQYELGEKEKDDLYEWVLAHKAVWGDVFFNLRAALENQEPEA